MKILILVQIPPPSHGQSIMQKYLVDVKWNWCDKKFIQLNFSKSIEEVGKFNIKKIFNLIKTIYKLLKERLKGKIDIIFYPPSGSNKIPFYRDILILFFIRWCTKKTIFQFHAGGFDILYNKLNSIEKLLALITYKNSNASIILSPNLSYEIDWIKPKRIYIVSNGIEDHYKNSLLKRNGKDIAILTVGMISKSKGIVISTEAARILKEKNLKFIWNFIGNFQSKDIKHETEIRISEYGLENFIKFLGFIDGTEKFSFYSNADIFCFPTYYENEAMPLVLLEAMMMSLPIVATNWRGIPNIIDDTKNGLLVPIKDPLKVAESIEILVNNVELRINLGKNARKKFLKEFTIEKHLKKMEDVFKEIAYGSK